MKYKLTKKVFTSKVSFVQERFDHESLIKYCISVFPCNYGDDKCEIRTDVNLHIQSFYGLG